MIDPMKHHIDAALAVMERAPIAWTVPAESTVVAKRDGPVVKRYEIAQVAVGLACAALISFVTTIGPLRFLLAILAVLPAMSIVFGTWAPRSRMRPTRQRWRALLLDVDANGIQQMHLVPIHYWGFSPPPLNSKWRADDVANEAGASDETRMMKLLAGQQFPPWPLDADKKKIGVHSLVDVVPPEMPNEEVEARVRAWLARELAEHRAEEARRRIAAQAAQTPQSNVPTIGNGLVVGGAAPPISTSDAQATEAPTP